MHEKRFEWHAGLLAGLFAGMLTGFLAGMAATLATPARASDFSDWLKQQQQGVAAEKKAFQAYKDERDREFTAFLKAQWKAVDLLKGKRRDETPKPVVMPVAKPLPPKPPATPAPPRPQPVVQTPPKPQPHTPARPLSPPAPAKPPVAAPTPTPTHPPVRIKAPVATPAPAPKPAPPAPVRGERVDVDFFGRHLVFYVDAGLRKQLTGRVDKHGISDYWSALSRADYEPLLKQLEKQQHALHLTDWAFASLVHKLSSRFQPEGSNEAALLSWFLLVKSGYRARIAYSQQTVYLLAPSQQELFEVPYFTFDGKRFYVVSFDGRKKTPGQVYTYDAKYPGVIHALDMHVNPVVAANDQRARRRLSFKYRGKPYSVEVVYDRGRIAFFKTYPQMALAMYFSSEVDPATATPLQRQLAAYMQGMDELEAVNFLLRFVQTALKYQTDEQQFGEENYLFPEETLFYPYSDCEDRAVLFAWLVKSLLGLDVIGLDFPGHVATAVHFSQPVKGDSVRYNGKTYTVADPTYINANAGMTMPDYKHTKPGIIAYRAVK